MPFGLCIAPSTFQRLMQLVLAGLQWSVCLVYLDDIIIYSRSIAEHLYRLWLVLQRLRHGGLKIKPSKCHFLNKSVKYLGHIISAEGIRTDPDKTAVIHQWPAPTKLKELRQFLGFASYYRQFIKNFANIAAPLYKLTEKQTSWEWTYQHRPGQQHTNADSLSRIDHSNQCGETMLDEQAINAISSVSKWVPEWSIDELKAHQSKDPDIKEMINWIQTNTLPKTFPREVSQKLQTLWCQCQQLQIGQDGILYRLWEDVRGRGSNPELQIVLPLEMVFIVLTQLHDSATAGHLGIQKTLDKVQRRFYWPGQRRDVEDWCRSCSKCKAGKLPVRPHHAPMQIETAGKPLQRVSMDILGPLPETKRHNRYILVIGD